MRFKYLKTGVLLVCVLLLVFVTPISFADNYEYTYSFQAQFGLLSQKLYVSVPSSLYDYYQAKPHRIANDGEYSQLVTPDVFGPVADSLRNLTSNDGRSDEAFANAVLMLVHQVQYSVGEIKYPVETLVENSGKCDTLSLLAASIMKAGGLDVVLLYYKGANHVNVGVYLPYEPYSAWWQSPTAYEFNGKNYWVAECTPASEWKVGELPSLLLDAKPWIISLENTEESSPAHVSSKLNSPMMPSSISIYLSSNPVGIFNGEQPLIISGSISPAYPNETVALYFSQDGTSYTTYITETDYFGNYFFSWNFNSTGTYYIRTSWSGTSDYACADSETVTVFIGFPKSLIKFEGPGFYYAYGNPGVAAYELSRRQGVEEFLNVNFSGTGALLTGDFIILRSGQTLTIPIDGQATWITQKISIPKGLQPQRIPDDIGQTTNSQFGFILRDNGENDFSVEVRGWDNFEMPSTGPLSGSSTAFMNTSAGIKENTWYTIEAKMSEGGTTAKLYDVNGTVLENLVVTNNAIDISELVVLLTNNTDRAVVFKNLKVETLNQPTQLPEGDEATVNEVDMFAMFVSLTILIAAFFAAAVYVKNRKKTLKITESVKDADVRGNYAEAAVYPFKAVSFGLLI